MGQPVIVTATEAVRHIKRGMRLLIGSGCAEPQHLVRALVDQAEHFRDNEIVHLLTMGIAPYADPQYRDRFRHNAFFIGPNVRQSVSSGDSDYTPIFLSEIPNLFYSGQMPLHAALVQVSTPDDEGMVSLSVSVDIVLSAVRSADIVIAQMNPRAPRTQGLARIPLSDIDYLVEHEEPLIELPRPQLDEISMKIGRNVARLIKDGDTLQLGIGGIPDATLKQLADKNDLGIHTEMFANGFVPLYQNGNITNKRKGIHDGVSITSFIMGDAELYDLVSGNPDIEFHPSEYTNDPFVIAQNRNMVSVNSAIEVDLTGQVCADSLGSRFFSGIGGQVDFVRGARRSQGGRSIIALPSTAKKGTVSRIVSQLHGGAGVVTSRGDVQYVVTEYGVAYLHGMTVRERALALVQIAHPDFRDELLDNLKERRYVRVDQRVGGGDAKRPEPVMRRFGEHQIHFRDLRAADERTLQAFFYSHSRETILQRYFFDAEDLRHEKAVAACAVDYAHDTAVAGFASDKPEAPMVCVGRFITQKDPGTAVLGVVVRESYQGMGIGAFLTEWLVSEGRKRGLKTLYAYVLSDNERMLKQLHANGFQQDEDSSEPLLLYRLDYDV